MPRMVGQASLALALSVRALAQARGCILAWPVWPGDVRTALVPVGATSPV